MVEEASHFDQIARSQYNPSRVLIGAPLSKSEKLKWIWWTKIQPLGNKALAIGCCLLSALVVLGEVTLFRPEAIGVLPMLFKESYGELWTQTLCILPLLYISFCTYFGLFQLKLTGFYGLYRHNLTDPVHLLKSACMFCRLVNPLCLNFVYFLKVQGCQLTSVMGAIDLVPLLGRDFSVYFPGLLVVLCGLNVGNCYSRFMEYLGIPQFKFSDSDESLSTQEGEALIKRGKAHPALQDRDSPRGSTAYIRNSELAELQIGLNPSPKRSPTEIRKKIKSYYVSSP